jgi:hypothetical protein
VSEFSIVVIDGLAEPPRFRFETQTRTKLLGSAKALARALYEKRHADGYPGDLVRVQHEGVPVFTFSLLDRLDEARCDSSSSGGE